MGSIGFDGEDEYQSSNDKYKLPRTLLDECGAVNHASVPRKLRSAIKKQRRGSVTPPLSILRKHYHMLDGIGMLRKNGSKRSKLNMKRRQVTKDEEEVAETLNALADMFSDANKATQPRSNNEPPEINSSAAPEAEVTGNRRLQEESRKITSSSTLKAACRIFGDTQLELPSSNHLATPSASGNQSNTRGPRSSVSTVDTGPCVKQTTATDQVTVPRTQHGKHYYPMDDRNSGSSMSASLSARGALISNTQGSCLRLPTWSENPNPAFQSCAIEEITTAEKHPQAHKSWNRCSAHVYICRLINVLQISERRDGSPENPTQSTTCEGAELQIHPGMHNQMASQLRSLQHWQLASETSALCNSTSQCYDFLSLDNGAIIRKGHSTEAPKQFHAPYMQPQNGHSSTFPGHTSASAAQQVQVPQYLSSLPFRIGQRVESQQQWGTVNLQTLDNTRVASSLHLNDWGNGGNFPSLQNYAHTVFPHLLSSQHLQFSTPQPQFTSINSSSSLPSSIVEIRHQHQFPWQFERNRAALHPENIQQLQQPCYNHLPN